MAQPTPMAWWPLEADDRDSVGALDGQAQGVRFVAVAGRPAAAFRSRTGLQDGGR
jgi:hypothetical protein